MIDAVLTADDARLVDGAMTYQATAREGSTRVDSFMAFLSPNGKELHAFFTTDAFAVFPGVFDLDFHYGGRVIHTVEMVDIATALIPLPSFYVALGLPDADNDWLANL